MFSLKRNKKYATNTIETQQVSSNKLSRFFNKLTHSITPQHELKKPSITNLSSLFKSDSYIPVIRQDSILDKDKCFERQRYHKTNQIKVKEESTSSQTIPSILIRRPSLTTSSSSSSSLVETSKYFSSSSIDNKNNSNITNPSSINGSSNLTTHSGDLTAKQFADIAGIKILSEDDGTDDSEWINDQDEGDDLLVGKVSATHLTKMTDQDKSSSICTYSTLLSRNESTASSQLRKQSSLQIWDSAFWHDGFNEQSNSLLRKTSAPPQRHKDNPMPNIIHELRRINTISNEYLTNQYHHQSSSVQHKRSCVIRKGRFEISLETTDSTEPASTTTSGIQSN
ncbi:uncharacterized protein BX664DRAFT_319365 [Halteromyces radiatus]|uniref:uncharacterized protein n=1 Tax=Halteromyces radiatus TaxID=101107 RepID=UPI00221E5E77|nr:uncharacterized protein BX664DRAFT_319365 [Halteromyces radiatus]KAI8098697.1 hypothetical protein BX664DRAFT_319365 [Halteromyces radiatus]